jgi:hypothetical protein
MRHEARARALAPTADCIDGQLLMVSIAAAGQVRRGLQAGYGFAAQVLRVTMVGIVIGDFYGAGEVSMVRALPITESVTHD